MTAIDGPRSDPGFKNEAILELANANDAAQEDRALLQRLRAGEDSAFGELFARHSAAVRRLAFGLVNDRAEAEDLTAEAFFRVLQAIRRGAGPVDNVRGYLLIVARRVAWEWQARRRDVPVSDEELSHRAGSNPDTTGAATERNLITRAFASLPERWRSVLWKVEVEGERPAVVANNFGLSANATAALARRARQGLRAAYLQAHLEVECGSTGCRQVLEKLGAYTAGSVTGSERRRIRSHLAGCASCTAMHDELREVCSGLRAHAGMLAVPVVAVAGVGVTVKSALAGAKLQVAMAASSATVVGVLGLVSVPWVAGDDRADDYDGRRGVELTITGAQPTGPSMPESIALTTGSLSTAATVPPKQKRRDPTNGREPPPPDGLVDVVAAPARPLEPGPGPGRADTFDDSAPVVLRETSVQRYTEEYDGYTVVVETTSVVEVNSVEQTRTSKHTRRYTEPKSTTDEEPKSVTVPAEPPTAGPAVITTTIKPTTGAKPAE
jgi:RNA polymerase sigma factor (sigma-70 family)